MKAVEEKIPKMLPNLFSVIFDGWTNGDSHYVAIYAPFSSDNKSGCKLVLLAFSLFENETSQGASDHREFITLVLELYVKPVDNLVALVGDNCYTKRTLASSKVVGFVGCASHRYNLAMKDLLHPLQKMLDKFRDIMSKFRYPIHTAKLRQYTNLKPKLPVFTLWSSAIEMIVRHTQIREFFPKVEIESVTELLLNPWEDRNIDELVSKFEDLHSITKYLQGEHIKLSDVRVLFDEVIQMYAETQTRLGTNAAIVEYPEFETALVNIQLNRSLDMTESELLAVSKPKIDSESTNSSENARFLSFAARALKKLQLSRVAMSIYADTHFILPTSNICKHLFQLQDSLYLIDADVYCLAISRSRGFFK